MNLSHNKDLSNTNVVFKNLERIGRETRVKVNVLEETLSKDYTSDIKEFRTMIKVGKAILRELLRQ